MLRAPLLCLLALGAASPAARADGEDGELDLLELARETRAAAGSPAIGLVVWKPGAEPQIVVDGRRSVDSEEPVTADDPWHFGSITKSMTATLVARLVERGAVGWDDTVEEWLGPIVPEMRAEYGPATFRHLLSHRAGLQANIPVWNFGAFGQHPDDGIAERLRWIRIALAQEPIGPLEESFLYSNDGYVVAGAMLEEATGKTFEELLRQEVFEPLGIEGAGFGAPPEASAPRGHVLAEDGSGRRPVPDDADNPAPIGPAGRVHMPLAGIARYLAAHATRDPEFLGADSWATLQEPPFGGNYALGWIVMDESTRWHNGSNTMWYAEAAFDRDSGAVVAIAVNDGHLAAVQPFLSIALRRVLEGN